MWHSDYLFARPSFLEGVARIFDPTGSLDVYNQPPTGEAADAVALQADWEAIGTDIAGAAAKFGEQSHLELQSVETEAE